MSRIQAHMSRRNMLVGLAAAGVIGAIAMAAKTGGGETGSTDAAASGAGGSTRPASLATAEIEHWMAEVGASFDIAFTRMRLAGVTPLEIEGAPRPANLRQRPFVAVFDLPQGQTLPGNLVYRIVTRNYPAFDIFLDEPAPTALRRMRAVFN